MKASLERYSLAPSGRDGRAGLKFRLPAKRPEIAIAMQLNKIASSAFGIALFAGKVGAGVAVEL